MTLAHREPDRTASQETKAENTRGRKSSAAHQSQVRRIGKPAIRLARSSVDSRPPPRPPPRPPRTPRLVSCRHWSTIGPRVNPPPKPVREPRWLTVSDRTQQWPIGIAFRNLQPLGAPLSICE